MIQLLEMKWKSYPKLATYTADNYLRLTRQHLHVMDEICKQNLPDTAVEYVDLLVKLNEPFNFFLNHCSSLDHLKETQLGSEFLHKFYSVSEKDETHI